MEKVDKTYKEIITVSESQVDINGIVNKKYISPELKDKLLSANVLIVPNEGYPERPELIYLPSGTSDLFHFLEENKGENLIIDVCIEERNYKELALHADLLILAEFVVKEIVAPLLVALLADFIIHRIGKRQNSTTVKSKMKVIRQSGKKTIEYSYEGPASTYKKIMLNEINKLNNDRKLLLPKKAKRHHRKK